MTQTTATNEPQAANATDRVQSLIELTQSLSDIFQQENTLLTDRRPREIEPLQAEKARLAAAYAQTIRDIAANRAIVEGAGGALLSELRAITKTFEARAAKQRALLTGAATATEGVVKAVAAEAADAKESAAYSAKPKTAPGAAPISVDENA